MSLGQAIISLTVLGLLLYYFIGKADQSSKFIEAGSAGYVSALKALQGR